MPVLTDEPTSSLWVLLACELPTDRMPTGLDLPNRLPGRPSWPKNSLLESNASARRTSNCVRPSKPAISLPSLDCKPLAIFSTVKERRPFLSTWYLFDLSPEKTPCPMCQHVRRRGQGAPGSHTVLNISKLATAMPSDLL